MGNQQINWIGQYAKLQYQFSWYYGPYQFIYYQYIVGTSGDGIYINMLHKSKENLARILVYKIWISAWNACYKLEFYKIHNISVSVLADMAIAISVP